MFAPLLPLVLLGLVLWECFGQVLFAVPFVRNLKSVGFLVRSYLLPHSYCAYVVFPRADFSKIFVCFHLQKWFVAFLIVSH